MHIAKVPLLQFALGGHLVATVGRDLETLDPGTLVHADDHACPAT